MTPLELAAKIATKFKEEFIPKFMAGQKEHGGLLTDMGAYQSLKNIKDEIQDLVSYVYVLEKCLDEIRGVANTEHSDDTCLMDEILEILNRLKDDNNLDEPIGYELTEENR